MRNKSILCLVLIIIFSSTCFSVILASDIIGYNEESVVKVYDQNGKYIFGTAMTVSKGDRYISQNNVEYVIEKVTDNKGTARKVGKVNLLEGITTETNVLPPLAARGKKLVGIYHTHNDESYKPGPVSVKGNGDIFDVGAVMKNALEAKGIRVIHSENLHLPHDGAAYERSRATAIDIAKKRPDAIFDAHRDAIPREEEYLEVVKGKKISQVRLVVGRQNPNRKVNSKFAQSLKALADKHYPGLIRDIFFGKGNYNQQISPRSVLLEFGTHVTTKQQAQASAKMLADSVSQLLYGGQGNQPAQQTRSAENRGALSTIAWIIGILVISVTAYLFINEGSWEGVINRIKKFLGRELIE